MRRRQHGQAESLAPSVPVGDTLGQRDVPPAFERSEHRPIRPEQAPWHLPRKIAPEGTNELLQSRPLPRGAMQESRCLGQPRRIAERGGEREEQLPAGSEDLLPERGCVPAAGLHQGRQRRPHPLAERTHIVLCNPLPQSHLPLRKQRHPAVEHLADGL